MHVFRLTDDLLHGRLFVRHLSLPLIRACSLLIGAYRSSSGSLNIESPTVDVFRCYRHQKKKAEKYNKRKKWNNFQPPFRFNLSLDFCSNKLILYFKLLPQTQFARAQSSCLYFHLAQETLPINIYASFFFPLFKLWWAVIWLIDWALNSSLQMDRNESDRISVADFLRQSRNTL